MKHLMCILLPLALLLGSCGSKKAPSDGGAAANGATPKAAFQGNTTTLTLIPPQVVGSASAFKIFQEPKGTPPIANSVHITMVTNAMSTGLSLYKSSDGVTYTALGKANDNLPVTQASTYTWYRIQSNEAATTVNEMTFDNPQGLFSGMFKFNIPSTPPKTPQALLNVVDDFMNY